jgi:hypothetical protein
MAQTFVYVDAAIPTGPTGFAVTLEVTLAVDTHAIIADL